METPILTRLQDLTLDVLLLIFDLLEWQYLAPLSTTCHRLKNAVDAYLRYQSGVHLTNSQEESQDSQLISDFTEVVCKHKSIALSIRRINVSIKPSFTSCSYALSDEARLQLRKAVQFLPNSWFLVRDAGLQIDHQTWLPLTLLMCRNLERITITTGRELKWQLIAQCLQYPHWPNDRLRHVDITWTATGYPRAHRSHDLQDVWLLFSAPNLKSLTFHDLRQGNNLYAGGVDLAAIRTIYWPIELETLSLYHHSYGGECHHGREPPANRPTKIPMPSGRLPINHGFSQLQRLILRQIALPDTWYSMLMPCFKAVRHLELSIATSGMIAVPAGHLPDLRLLKLGLEHLNSTLETIILDIQTPRRRIDWINAVRCGFVSIGSLQDMLNLQSATLPWYAWLPCERPRADPHGPLGPCKIHLPPKLESLALSRCELASPGVITELVNATIASKLKSNTRLKTIVLQADIELVLKQADFAQLARRTHPAGVEVVLEKVKISDKDFVVYDRV